MANSILTYIGDGVTTQFPLNFSLGILKKADVTCRVGDEVDSSGNPLYRSWEYVQGNTGMAQITSGSAPASGIHVVFERSVSVTELVHDYQDGDPLDEKSLDESFKQCIMIAQQAIDARFEVGSDIDMKSFTLRNIVPDESDPSSVVTWGALGILKDDIAALVVQAEAAVTESSNNANDSMRYAMDAETSSIEADGSAYISQAWAESESNPDPDDENTKSSKTWALQSQDSATSAANSSTTAQMYAEDIESAVPSAVQKVITEGNTQVSRVESEGTEQMELLANVVANAFITGSITMFSGTFSGKHPIDKVTGAVNTAWALCDGTNGTPNLVNKFIYGGNGQNQGVTGGSTVTQGHTLSIAQMPSHAHEIDVVEPTGNPVYKWGVTPMYDSAKLGGTTTKGGNQAHSHNQNLPPYYTLAYIMKIA